MSDPFEGRVCVVTGAGSGIGRALARSLASRGARLAISDIDPVGLVATERLIDGESSNRIRADTLDVSDAAAIDRYALIVRESLGTADYVFNVAGLSRIGAFKDTPLSSVEKVMNVNYWGVVRMSKAFLPQLLETKGGLVNISSIYGVIGVPTQSHYCSSKFAVRGFTETLATELAEDGVRVICVHPGGVATNIARNAVVDALPPTASSAEEVAANFDKIAITSPEAAAEAILRGAAKGKRRVMIGRDARLISFIQRLFPESYMKIILFLRGDPSKKAKRAGG